MKKCKFKLVAFCFHTLSILYHRLRDKDLDYDTPNKAEMGKFAFDALDRVCKNTWVYSIFFFQLNLFYYKYPIFLEIAWTHSVQRKFPIFNIRSFSNLLTENIFIGFYMIKSCRNNWHLFYTERTSLTFLYFWVIQAFQIWICK